MKAKLETIDSGISTFESEFMSYIVDPATNRTVGEIMLPQIAASYEGRGSAPLMLCLEGAEH